MTDSGGLIERDLGEIGQRLREIHQRDLRIEQMLDVNQKHLAVLEPVEGSLLLFESTGLRQTGGEMSSQRLFVRSQFRFSEVFQNRKQIFEAQTQEVVPQEVARADRMSGQIHSLLAGGNKNHPSRNPLFPH